MCKHGRLIEKRGILDSGLQEESEKRMGLAVTRYTYDANGNRIGIVTPEGYQISRQITYSHDLKDRLTRVEELDGPVVMASYDKNDRIETRKTLLPAGEEQYGETLFCYDIYGNLTESRENGKTAERNEYDRKNRIIKNTDADGIELSCRYGIQDEQRQLFTAGSREQNKAAQTITYNARNIATGTEDGCGNRTGYTLDGCNS